MMCSARAWAPTICALYVRSVPISPASCVRRVCACAAHCCDKNIFDAVLARFSRKSKNNNLYSLQQKTTQHPLDLGLGSVGQHLTVEGARTGFGLQLAPLTVPRAIAPLIYVEPAD